MRNKKILIIVSGIVLLVSIGFYMLPWFSGKVWIDPPETLVTIPEALETPDGAKKPKICGEKAHIWSGKSEIDGVEIRESLRCEPDNPWGVASFVKGTNNVSMMTLMKTRLASDAVIKKNDRDGDGDPDYIHITLEVSELNGSSPDGEKYLPTYDIAPGVRPGIWAFTPKTRGMAAINLFSYEAIRDLRPPSPAIRVEQGDTVIITLENTHYLPHTIHLHGVDHPYITRDGEGNDGVPITDEHPVLPGDSKSYALKPRQTGTMFYHCHVQTDKHLMMGLQGMFIVEENRPNNWVQTLNVGAGFVRHPSVAISESYDHEYDLHYQGIDKELNSIIQTVNDPRLIAQKMNREYDMTESTMDYFLLNGRSFPYTLKESIIVVKPDDTVKLRIANGQDEVVSLHTHGHKATITHYDGVEAPDGARITRDVYSLSSAQRLDLSLSATDDGLHSYGPGVWLFHNHAEKGISTDGRNPGGDISMIVYQSFLQENGFPKLQGVDINRFLDPRFYQGTLPIWEQSKAPQLLGQAGSVTPELLKVIIAGLILGLLIGLILWLFMLLSGSGKEANS